MNAAVPFLLGLLVTAGLIVPVMLRLRAAASALRARGAALEAQLVELQRSTAQLEKDQDFLNGFLREFPRLAGELYSGPKERQIPVLLLQVVTRSLAPRQAAILVRRRPRHGSGETRDLYVVAAVTEGATLEPGTELPEAEGALNFAAEAQQVLNRHDLEAETAISGRKLESELEGLAVDLVAPMVHEQQTLGLIVLQRPQRTSGEAKAALRLIAQTGAQSLNTAATYSRMKVTAETDGLTMVFNKRHVTRVLSDLIYKAACVAYDRRQSRSTVAPPALSVFLFDLDHFKNYNDRNGHVAGDRLLQDLSRLVERSIRRDDVFGRFGGEEFLVVMPETNRDQALAAASKLRDVIANHAFPFAESQPLGRISISGGVAEYPSNGQDANALLGAADAALYEAKRSGRNRVLAAMGNYQGTQAPRTGPQPKAKPDGGKPEAAP